MTFLATEIGHEETLWTFGMAFARGQLPSARTTDALVSAGAAASHAAQITLGTRAQVAIISEMSARYSLTVGLLHANYVCEKKLVLRHALA